MQNSARGSSTTATRGRGSASRGSSKNSRGGGGGGHASRGLTSRGGRGRGSSKPFISDKTRQSVLDMSRYLDKSVKVKFLGGREVIGTLKGWDPLLSLVLDDAVEAYRDPLNGFAMTDKVRQIGLMVCKGTAVMTICPMDGCEEIENPFLSAEEQS